MSYHSYSAVNNRNRGQGATALAALLDVWYTTGKSYFETPHVACEPHVITMLKWSRVHLFIPSPFTLRYRSFMGTVEPWALASCFG